jgi:recombination protein RecR
MSDSIKNLIDKFRSLPGVGPKSAQRLAYYILDRARDDGLHLAAALRQAITNVGHCKICQLLSETEICRICSNPKRDRSLLCIVETPADVAAIEQTNSYRGRYFVLGGRLSPLDGIGPNEIGIENLQLLLTNDIQEVIIATNPTIEGEITAEYLTNLITNKNIKCSRIAHGVPMGGELEYTDSNTLECAFTNRRIVSKTKFVC